MGTRDGLGVPEDKFRRNFTDTHRRVMPGHGRRDPPRTYPHRADRAVVDGGHRAMVVSGAASQTQCERREGMMPAKTIAATSADTPWSGSAARFRGGAPSAHGCDTQSDNRPKFEAVCT